jgi:hypothetical protein
MLRGIDPCMVSAPCRSRKFDLERYTGGSLSAGKATHVGQKFHLLPIGCCCCCTKVTQKRDVIFLYRRCNGRTARHLAVIPVTTY